MNDGKKLSESLRSGGFGTLVFAAICLGLNGCGTVTGGPFVTNLSSDGLGNLSIEKCTIQVNEWSGGVNNGDCHTTTLRITAPGQETPQKK